MAELIWTEPALSDLDAIADYIELDNPEAARGLVQRVFQHVEQLAKYPESGSRPRELRGLRYRQIVEAPCRVFYRYDGERVFILYVMRGEMRLRERHLTKRERQTRKV
jgi:toxin ParE1/3/4